MLQIAESAFCDAKKVCVAAGVGVRAYYISLGYELDAHGYMTKDVSLPTPNINPSQHLKGVVGAHLSIPSRETFEVYPINASKSI